MGKAAPDAMIDASLNYVGLSNIQHICSAEPANYAGIAAVSLGSVAMTPTTDFPVANGDTSGRKFTTAAKTGVSVTASGSANHLVLALTTDSTLRFVTTCTSQALTSGNTANIPAWKDEIADPA